AGEPHAVVDTATHKLPADPGAALTALTDVVAELVRQTHPGAARHVTPDSRLDADLGLDSLARIELLHRIEDAFGLRLAERTLLSIETPRELLSALRSAAGMPAGPSVWERPVEAPAAQDAPAPRPDHVDTLTAVLDWHAERA